MKKNSVKTLDNSNKKSRGRPKGSGEKYNANIYPDIVKSLASQGYIETQIQEIIHISVATFNKWKKEHPEFLKSLKEGKANPDKQVVAAIFKNAIGGLRETEKALVVSDGKDVGSHIEIVKVKEYHPGNVTAQIYWTKNRMPKEWKDKQDIEHSGAIETITPTKDQLQEIINAIKSSRNIN